MITLSTPGSMSRLCARWRARGLSTGLVPTMGALHRGHASLIRKAAAENDRVVVSVFVNPTQFGPKEDFRRYPRPFAADQALCRREGVHALFHPDARGMYPPGFATLVSVRGLSELLCGASRPGHFQGVATVVLKLFHIVRPDRAYFGEKDYQQLAIIKRMVADLDVPVRVIGCPTVREADGLALSSRNAYLDAGERNAAPMIRETLVRTADAVRKGERPARVLSRARRALAAIPGARLDYVSLVDAETLRPGAGGRTPRRLLAAVKLGRTRLIDNIDVS